MTAYCGKHGYTYPRSEGCPVCRKECELEENNARSVPRRNRKEQDELA